MAYAETVNEADHPDIAASHANLASILDGQGKYKQARSEFRLALSAQEKLLGPEHPTVASIRNNLARGAPRVGVPHVASVAPDVPIVVERDALSVPDA